MLGIVTSLSYSW